MKKGFLLKALLPLAALLLSVNGYAQHHPGPGPQQVDCQYSLNWPHFYWGTQNQYSTIEGAVWNQYQGQGAICGNRNMTSCEVGGFLYWRGQFFGDGRGRYEICRRPIAPGPHPGPNPNPFPNPPDHQGDEVTIGFVQFEGGRQQVQTLQVNEFSTNKVVLLGRGRRSSIMIQEVLVVFDDGRWERLDALSGVISDGARKEVFVGGFGNGNRPGGPDHDGPGYGENGHGPGNGPQPGHQQGMIRSIRVTGYNQNARDVAQVEVRVGSDDGYDGPGPNQPPPPPHH